MPALLMLLGVGLLPGPAQAAGYYLSDMGVRSFSRAGAYVAGADDLMALYYNPAALMRVRDGHFTLNVGLMKQPVTFDREDYPGADPNGGTLVNEEITNQGKAFPIPDAGIAHSLGVPRTTFALGFYPPYAADFSYPADGPQRYSLIDTAVAQSVFGPTVAHQALDWLAVGVGVSWNVLYVKREQIVTLSSNPTVETPDYDVGLAVEGWDRGGIAWNTGLLIEPIADRLAIGVSVTPPISFSMAGEMRIDLSNNAYYTEQGLFLEPTGKDPDILIDIRMPLIARVGILGRTPVGHELELTVVWQRWSMITEILVQDLDLALTVDPDHPAVEFVGGSELVIEDDVSLPASLQDSFSFRLGGHYLLGDDWVLRSGLTFETSAVPSQSQSVGGVDAPKWGYGTGVGYRLGKRVMIDLGWAQLFLKPREITDSEVRQVVLDLLQQGVVQGRVVGDGTLSSRAWLMGLGIDWRFGRTAEEKAARALAQTPPSRPVPAKDAPTAALTVEPAAPHDRPDGLR